MSIIETIVNNFGEVPELMEIIPNMPNEKEKITNAKFQLSEDGSRYIMYEDGKEKLLIDPRSHNHSIDDVKDVVLINDIPCYVYQNKEGKYSIRPALEGSGMAVDAYCFDIDSWGEYGDFEKVACRCGYQRYVNVRQIPKGDKYEIMCHKCGNLIIKKRV